MDGAILGLIPARGGSKGVARKNVRPLGAVPLIGWTISAALGSRSLASVVVSTDDHEIAEVARTAGARVPFMRPTELATDQTPTLPVIRHALGALEALGERYDAVCLLQPTSPFRTSRDIDESARVFTTTQATGLVTVRQIPAEHHPQWALVPSADGLAVWASGAKEPPSRRQDLPAAYHRDGAVYITRAQVIVAGSLYGEKLAMLQLDNPRIDVNIDTPADWERAEALLSSEEQ